MSNYKKENDTWSTEHLIKQVEQSLEDIQYNLKRNLSPKRKRELKTSLEFFTSVLGRLQQYQSTCP